jgi:short-subunit dehydrogenase
LGWLLFIRPKKHLIIALMTSYALADKVVIVTGASSGIGEEIARQAARAGARLVLAARRAERLQALEAEIRAAGGQAISVPTNLRVRGEILDLVKAALDQWGQLDMLVNNAGLSYDEPLMKMDPLRVHEELEVNLGAVVDSAQAALKPMLMKRFGHILNVASIAGLIALPGNTIYNATKWGVVGFSEALNREVSRYGVRVSAFCPGFVATDFSPRLKAIKENHPGAARVPGVMSVQYVASRAVWLLQNPRRRYIIPHSWTILVWAAQTFPWGADWVIPKFIK